MMDRFGPWSSALGDDGPAPRLDTFWKRRLTFRVATRSTRCDWCLLTLAAVASLVVPPLHLASAQEDSPAQPAGSGKIYVQANFNPPGTRDDRLSGLFAIDPLTAKRARLAVDFQFNVRVSPDGRTVALSRSGTRRDGQPLANSGYWTLATDGQGEIRKIRDVGGTMSWSPDSKELIVTPETMPIVKEGRVEFFQTWRLNADGSGARKLPIPTVDRVADWSPDGQWIVTFADRRLPTMPSYQLYIMHLDGTDERQISDGIGRDFSPRFAPDGKKVAYLHAVGYDQSIQVVNLDGTGRRILVQDSPERAHDQFAWSPDGRSIVYRVRTPVIDQREGWKRFEERGIQPRLMLINADGTNPRPLPTPAALAIGNLDWR